MHSKWKEYDVFSVERDPQLYQSRFQPPSGFDLAPDSLHIAPIPTSGQETSGTFRSDRNKEVEKEELLHLRFHYRNEISDADLEQLTRVLKNQVVNSKRIKAHRVSALGKYNIATYDLTTRNMMKRFGNTWMTKMRRRGASLQQSAPDSDIDDLASPSGAAKADENALGLPAGPSVSAPSRPATPLLLTPGPSEHGGSRRRLRSDREQSIEPASLT